MKLISLYQKIITTDLVKYTVIYSPQMSLVSGVEKKLYGIIKHVRF